MMEVRRLTRADTGIYRASRLEALQCEPTTFGGSFEEALNEGDNVFAAMLERSAIFGAFDEFDLVGTASIQRGALNKLSHKALVWGMYVRATHRRCGIGSRLLSHLLDYARGEEIEVIQLHVVTSNLPARRFYEKNDFTCYGQEERAMKIDGQYFSEDLMQRVLSH